MFGILNRTIFVELTKVFVLALVGMTGILVMAGLVTYASQQGLNPYQILQIIPLIIPDMLPYSVPTTMLFATCIVYGRLAHDNEILAIRAAGINVFKVVWPGIILGLGMSLTTLALYYHVIPYTHHLMKTHFLGDIEEFLYAALKRDGEIRQPKAGYAMWVHHVQGRRLLDVTFKKSDNKGGYEVQAVAREADLRVDLKQHLLLVHMRHGNVKSEGGNGALLHFEDRVWEVPLPPVDATQKLRTRDMTWREMMARRQQVALEQDSFATEIAMVAARSLLTNPPTDLPKHLANLRMIHNHKLRELQALDAEMQMRPALSFGCICFVLVGCPVGIWFSRSDYLSGFITCFLPIVFIYYPILLCGNNLARDGKVHAAVGIWGANATMALIACGLFRKLLRN